MRKQASARILAPFFIAIMLLAFASPVRASGVAFKNGDVFAGITSGDVFHFSRSGVLLDTLVPANPGYAAAGMAFNSSGFLYSTGFFKQLVNVYNSTGSFVSTFGSGYNGDPESIVFNMTGFAYVGQANGTGNIKLFGADGSFIKDFAPAHENRGTDWIDLNPNQCTMYYTSEGHLVKQFNVCTNTQMADFATGLPGANAYAHRLAPDGTTFVADTSVVVRLNSTGSVIQTYTPLNSTSVLFALNLDPDGKTFWTADLVTGIIYRFDIASGTQLESFSAGGSVGGLIVKGEITGGTGFVIPEVPYGTILATVLPLAALILYTRRQQLHFK